MEHEIYKNFCETLLKLYPKAGALLAGSAIKPQLISPRVLKIPKVVFSQVEAFRKVFFDIVESEDYQEAVLKGSPWRDVSNTPSAMTCFDFHFSDDQGLKLIEVNTNASLFLPYQILKQVHGLNSNLPSCQPELIDQDFLRAAEITFGAPPKKVIILDREPKEEGLYFEFLLFQEHFMNSGLGTEVHSLKSFEALELRPQSTLIYNRTTDFYFERPESRTLRDLYLSGDISVTPHPRGYALMADKNRLSLLRTAISARDPQLATMIPESKRFSDFKSRDEIWQQRKHLFFKPQNAFGGKGAFRGKSVSKSMFETLGTEDYMAQELCPPGKTSWDQDGEPIEMKFDLRFYVYREGLVDAGARLYQGQTTNMRTDFGGIAPLSPL